MTFKEFRISHLLSVEEMAKMLNVSKETIRKWENGKGIRIKNLRAIADTFNIEPEKVITLFYSCSSGSKN